MRDPFEQVTVRSRKAFVVTAASACCSSRTRWCSRRRSRSSAWCSRCRSSSCCTRPRTSSPAKRTGMKVTEFFVGFGPRIWSFTRGETEYGIKAVVLGGYCRIIGMTNLEDVAPEDEERAYRSKGYFARVGVAFAGPGRALRDRVHLDVRDHLHRRRRHATSARSRSSTRSRSVRQQAGLKAGDTLVSIDGKPITEWNQVAGVIQSTRPATRCASS